MKYRGFMSIIFNQLTVYLWCLQDADAADKSAVSRSNVPTGAVDFVLVMTLLLRRTGRLGHTFTDVDYVLQVAGSLTGIAVDNIWFITCRSLRRYHHFNLGIHGQSFDPQRIYRCRYPHYSCGILRALYVIDEQPSELIRASNIQDHPVGVTSFNADSGSSFPTCSPVCSRSFSAGAAHHNGPVCTGS